MIEDIPKKPVSADSHPAEDKYGYSAIISEKKIRKGQTRWNQFSEGLKQINPETLAGPMLDFGFGVGYFVLEGLRRKMDIWGVDLLPGKINRYRQLVDFTESPATWKNRCVVGNGEELPFRSNQFAAISSWYVFEHIADPGRVLREIVRITRRKGIIVIRAQDARNGWEGHCKIPWIPFLSKRLAGAWIDEFGRSPELRSGVYDITQPQVAAILEELDCRIVKKALPPAVLIKNHWQLATEEEIRQKAREVQTALRNGDWQPQPENLYIFAQKN
jgi:ubiquinone/menaquinone biosynthesis C-methylase UbiE